MMGAAPWKRKAMEDKNKEIDDKEHLTEVEMHDLIKGYDKPNEDGLCSFPTDIMFVLRDYKNG